MKAFPLIGISLAIIVLAACERENGPDSPAGNGEMSITIGFEQPRSAGQEAESKTYVNNGTRIRWSARAVDKVIYVFDSAGNKNAFTASATSASDSRTFTGSVTAGSEAKLVLWSGKKADDDRSEMTETTSDEENIGTGNEPIGEGGTIEYNTKSSVTVTHTILSGATLAVVNPQNIEFSNSFATDANISVMRPGDDKLISVFGYLRYTVPAGSDGSATIKSITITADEDIAGQIQIDCNEAAPAATIIAGGSKSLTVNTAWQTADGGYYEPGTLYAVLPAGTYHNMKITITPFAGSARTQDAETGTPFTINCKGDVVIKRGCYSSIGTLPVAGPSEEESAFVASGFFKKVVDKSGVVSYLVRSDVLPHSTRPGEFWANTQSVYFNGCEMSNDERFVIVMVSDNEFVPEYHNPSRNARILDLEKKKIYNFYADSGCYPYLDPVEDKLYYCRWNGSSAKIYRRDLLVNPSNEILMTEFPKTLLPSGASLRRAISHITITSDKQCVFVDTWFNDEFHWGLLNMYTGVWDEWGYSTTEHFTHGQLNPKHDDEAICATDSWHSYSQNQDFSVQYDPDGTTRRMQFVKKGFTQTIKPNPDKNGASHEGWSADGDHVYWCSTGINIRNIRTGEYRYVMQVNLSKEAAAHCNPSSDLKYWTFDDNYPGFYRGCGWKVRFLNDETGKQTYIHSSLPAIATSDQPSQLHPDPHPHFVCNDKYIICTAAQDDKNLHLSITPVAQLIALTQ